MNKFSSFYKNAVRGEKLSFTDCLKLYEKAPTHELIYIANEIRKSRFPDNKVTWLIDRNVNITNACVARCKFCNFHCNPRDTDKVYITSIEQYQEKIEQLFNLGGNQLLLQGGLNPQLDLNFYMTLFKNLKTLYPSLKLHALGPAEIHFLSVMENKDYTYVLKTLVDSGLDSLPGAGAEILSDRVRSSLSPGKCTKSQWLEVMSNAHKLGMLTSATMMFGHIETPQERIEHLLSIRELQDQKPDGSVGFISFIPWPFQDKNTVLANKYNIQNTVTSVEYIRLIATCRIILNNIKNIQASWLTVGKETAQMCLHAGANDFGSIMIEENVVSVAGATHSFDAQGIQKAIAEAGFIPQQRNQKFEYLN
jgi:cyclic dehypoxanthinyl futalosine synthase